MMNLDHYLSLSKLFEYPGVDYYDNVTKTLNDISIRYPQASTELEKFLELLPMKLSDLQELYSKSFEVQAVTSLDVGYVLYGDDYQRGVILVNLNNEHNKAKNDCGSELADFLPNLLRLLPKIKDDEVRNEMVTMLIATAVEKMMDEYSASALSAKDKLYEKQYKTLIVPSFPVNIFLHIFKALYAVLDSDFDLIKDHKPFADESFIGHIRGELEIQEGKQSSNSCGAGSCGAGGC
jgi:nitrate reductase assembly molybdenum cofactor insertion protein NarJ